tara:strand:+ start:200 stop:394 length:195 start_codon:yes stop_codon:yes gene_type:complete
MLQHNIWKELSKLVHVTALSALSKIYIDREMLPKIAECEKELRNYAFPLDIDLDDASVVFGDEK